MMDFFFPDMKRRHFQNELMDLPGCDKQKLLKTVNQFEMLNFLFTSSRHLIKKRILGDIKNRGLREITFLDIGSGGCDIPIWFVKSAKKNCIKVLVTCIDSDKRIVDFAKEKCKKYSEITVVHDSIYNLEKYGKFDYIFANHFLHHFEDGDIPGLLRLISGSCRNLFLLNDIKRSNYAFFSYSVFTGIFMHDSFAFYDGRLSIRKGFLKNELEKHLADAGIAGNRFVVEFAPSRICIIGNNS